jgi:hypothetical protein
VCHGGLLRYRSSPSVSPRSTASWTRTYFSSVLAFLWPALSRDQQRRLGPWLPHLIFAFLEPDHWATACALGEIGLTDEEISRVLRESLHETSVVRHIADARKAPASPKYRIVDLAELAGQPGGERQKWKPQ